MQSQWEKVTPAIARKAVETARCGRNPSMQVVAKYARDMADGRWARSPEPVIYGGDILRDGLQRHLALLKAAGMAFERGLVADPEDFSVTFYVSRGTPEEIDKAFPYINIGKTRSGNDYLAAAGRENPTLLHTVGRRIALWQSGHFTGNTYKPSRAEVLEILEPQDREGLDPDAEIARVLLIEEAAKYANDWNVRPPVPAAGTAGFLYWLLGQVDPGRRDVFMTYLRDATGIEDEFVPKGKVHPLVLLRTRLHADQYSATRRGQQVRQETFTFLCLRTWEHWRRGEFPAKLQMPVKLTDGHFRTPR